MVDKQALVNRLRDAGQEHLMQFWDELSVAGQAELATQLDKIDFDLVSQLVAGHDDAPNWSELAAKAKPPRAIRLDSAENEFSADEACERGEEALRTGQLGLILVAGGQGTRLNFDHPKGMFKLGPVSNRTLFQILIERLRAIARRYDVRISMYLMTSHATDAETHEFLNRNDRFGLAEADLKVFCQGTMPAVDAQTGRLLLADPGSLAVSPDGHGGTLAAFRSSGCMADTVDREIEHLFYCQIDNPLAQICDPTLIGYHLLADSDMTTQVVKKREATERVGNVVDLDGRTQIIEYSDLPDQYGKRTNADGSLLLWAGNLAIHIFRRQFLQEAAGQAEVLPFHRALKKVPHIDQAGNAIEPASANAIKFERFIFDLLPVAKNAIVIESRASEAFAPVKNANGAASDTPQHTQAAMIQYDRSVLAGAGAEVGPGVAVEVSPLYALDSDEARAKIQPAQRINEPTYFAAPEAATVPE
ncbi:MAG: UDP-N-acetylglucosamine pyrophosphorylase [Planctomycetaceae bacterium]|nr:UDP-N-acetylglucosamine pyrophosphorylase [Planctomycetaceae bacterium]